MRIFTQPKSLTVGLHQWNRNQRQHPKGIQIFGSLREKNEITSEDKKGIP